MDYKTDLTYFVLNADNNINKSAFSNVIENDVKRLFRLSYAHLMSHFNLLVMVKNIIDYYDREVKKCNGLLINPDTLTEFDLFMLGCILYLSSESGESDEGIPVVYQGKKGESFTRLSIRDQRFIIHYCTKSGDAWVSQHMLSSNSGEYQLLKDVRLITYAKEHDWTPIEILNRSTDLITAGALYRCDGIDKVYLYKFELENKLLTHLFTIVPEVKLRG